VECAWSVAGVCLECAWSVSGVCLECAWSVPGVCLGCAWSVPGVLGVLCGLSVLVGGVPDVPGVHALRFGVSFE